MVAVVSAIGPTEIGRRSDFLAFKTRYVKDQATRNTEVHKHFVQFIIKDGTHLLQSRYHSYDHPQTARNLLLP